MFVVLGLVTIVIGVITILILPDSPMQARFLSEAEKVALLKHVSVNQTGISQKKYKPKQAIEILLDMQLWLMTLVTILVCSLAFSVRIHIYVRRLDLDLQWCRYYLFSNSDQELWL